MKSIYIVMTDGSTMEAFSSLTKAVNSAITNWGQTGVNPLTVKVMVKAHGRYCFNSGVQVVRLGVE